MSLSEIAPAPTHSAAIKGLASAKPVAEAHVSASHQKAEPLVEALPFGPGWGKLPWISAKGSAELIF
jgi:hypothetical protein